MVQFLQIPFNLANVNRSPTAIISPQSHYIHVGELVHLRANQSTDPEGEPLTYHWTFLSVPVGSSVTAFTSILSDQSIVSFVPDVVGVYEVQLIVNDGLLDSEPAKFTLAARQLPVPHGQSYTPDMRWLYSFLRDWLIMVEDRDRAATLWSAAMEVASEVLLRLYEVNLSKSIKTIPELIQRKWEMFRLRVDLPAAYIMSIAKRQQGKDSSVSQTLSPSAVVLEQNISVARDRLIIVDGNSRATLSISAPQSYTNNLGVVVQGSRIAVDSPLPSAINHAWWSLPTGTLRFTNTSVHDLRCYSGDLLAVQLSIGSNAAVIYCRVWGVSPSGYVGFEFTRGAFSDSYNYFDVSGKYKAEVVEQIETALYDLDIDPGRYSFAELAIKFLDAALRGDMSYIENFFGIVMTPLYILRLSRYSLDPATIAVPYLQASIHNPVFILRQNQDYLVQEDEYGKYLILGDTVLLEESDLPRAFWAEVVYLDNAEAIENNFGILVGGEREKLPSSVTDFDKYRGSVAGLMYAFANGPTPNNIRLGVQIVLGLPFTVEPGIIRAIDNKYSTTHGLIVIEDVDDKGDAIGINRLYKYPLAATLEINSETGQTIKTGDVLDRFKPLCSGVKVLDWVNTPEKDGDNRAWWLALYDGSVPMPDYYGAFFDKQWHPGPDNPIPSNYTSPFQEIQKIHTFEVLLDPKVFNTEDTLYAQRFVKGVNETWRLGLEKKGIRPHYTVPLTLVSLELEDELNIRDKISLAGTLMLGADTTGYETVLSHDHMNPFSNPLNYHDAPLRGLRNTKYIYGHWEQPNAPGVALPNTVRLDVDNHSGFDFVVGEEAFVDAMIVVIVAKEYVLPQEGAPIVNEILRVQYQADNVRLPQHGVIEGMWSGAQASIINECAAEFVMDESYDLVDDSPDNSYHLTRYRDILYVDDGGIYKGRWGIFRINHNDPKRLITYQLRSDDPTAPLPLPYGASPPNYNSSFHPQTAAQAAAWVADTNTYRAQIERPFHNPIHDDELFMQDPDIGAIHLVASPAEFHELLLDTPIHRDNFRSGHMIRMHNQAGAEHLALFEIVRETDGSDIEAITSADLMKWTKDSIAPGVRVHGSPIAASEMYYPEIYDPRLPYPKEFSTALVANVPSQFEVQLPAIASNHDNYYVGMYFRALSGPGAWSPAAPTQGHYYICAYDGTTKIARFHRSHRNTITVATEFELVSFKCADHARPLHIIRSKFPAALLSVAFAAPLKSGDSLPAPCYVEVVSGSPTFTVPLVVMPNINPNGSFLMVNSHPADWPYEADGLGVQVGDKVVLHARGNDPADLALAGLSYTVTGAITSNTFDVTPTPAYNSTVGPAGGMFFTVYRPAPTTYRYDPMQVPPYVAGPPLLYSPVPEWQIW